MDNKLLRIPKIATWFYPRRIWYGSDDNIYLTFDDGPHPEITPRLLDLLREEKIKVSFFWQGEKIKQHSDLLKIALEDGHTIGHHGFKHVSNKNLSFGKFQLNFEQSQAMVPHGLYRPPYGIMSRKQVEYVLKSNKIIMWNYLSYDWDQSFSVEQVLSHFKSKLRKGDISVFHENDKTTNRIFQIIPGVINIVREKGLNFAPLPKK